MFKTLKQIRIEIPEDLHKELRKDAIDAGMTLAEYIIAKLATKTKKEN